VSWPVNIVLLRRSVAAALCAVQSLPKPRSRMDQMIASLLKAAFAGLDDVSRTPREDAIRIARHALGEWRAFYVDPEALAWALKGTKAG
jgi:hypothetical protein